MRRWWIEARAAATIVADHGSLWLPGALAWSLTLGWIPLVAAVARPPNVADLTFLGARIYSSGAWPWNAFAAGAGALLLVGIGFLLVGVAEATLATSIARRRPPSAREVARVIGISIVTSAPAIAALLATGTAFVLIAIREFTAPSPGDPLLRALARLAPFLGGVVLAWCAGAVVHAAAVRAAILGRAGMVDALAAAFPLLRRAGAGAAIQAVAGVILRVTYVVLATALLGVLWAPIGLRLGGGIDAALLPLLVGFVTIWLCLVLGGGALHAWGSATWTRVLGGRAIGPGRAGGETHGDPYRP
jgi:hypothetical protein